MYKKEFNLIKGVAAILLIVTHVFGLFIQGSHFFTIPLFNTGLSIETVIGRTADICVYMFAFISGFGLCFSYSNKNAAQILKTTIFRIIRFLLSYWLVIFIIYLPFYWAYHGQNFNIIELVKTMFGHHGFFSYGWYIYFYLLVCVTLPFISKLINIYPFSFLMFLLLAFI